MKISVAMATYNGARFLQQQLDSIRRQTLLPSELIVSDDGSSDDTVEIVRRFAEDAPFKVMIDAHGERLRFTDNFRRAIGLCTGDVVALCDQDDVWDEKKLAVCAAGFTDKTVMTVTHRVRVVDAQLNPTPRIIPPPALRGKYTLFNLDPWFSPNGMQMLFRREPIAPWLSEKPPLSVFPWFITEPFDEWIFHAGLLVGAALVLEDVLGVWRRHDATSTNDLGELAQNDSTTHKLNLALHSGGESYEFRATVADSRADFAARSVALPDGANATPVAGAVEYFRRLSRMYRRRARLHDPKLGRLQRLQTFCGMVAQNDYRRRNRGGLGLKAVLKDAFTIFFGPRSSNAADADVV